MKKEENFLRNWLESYKNIDLFFLQLTIALSLIGLIFAFSSSVYESYRLTNNFWALSFKQFSAFLIGLILMFFTMSINYRTLNKVTWQYSIAMLVLMLLLFSPLGVISGGSRRWLDLGFFQIQPAEITKLAVVLLLARFLTYYKWYEFKKYYYLGFSILLILIILKQPDLGSAGILGILTFQMLFLFGFPIWGLIPVSFLALAGVYFKIVSTAYQMNRIKYWLHPELDPQGQGYNLIQAKFAFGLGGFFGVGLGNSIQKEVGRLPIPHADFIFAVISEEIGFLGSSAILILYLVWVLRGLYLVNKVKDKYGVILGTGIVLLIGFQAIINLAVAAGLMPVTGVTLPFFSCGGTSLMVTLAMIGILFNIINQQVYESVSLK